jgi:Ca-activated chloride channel homolog
MIVRNFLLLFAIAGSAHALSWSELWLTKDQQAQKLMKEGQYKQAETTFHQPDWRAAAAYRAGHFGQAAEQYQALQTEISYYNQGNALTHLGKYEQAINAYDKALAINPSNKDALYNRKLVEDILKQERKKENKDQQGQNQQSQNQQQNQKAKDQQAQSQQGKSQQKSKDQQNKQDKKQQEESQKVANQQAKVKQGDEKNGKLAEKMHSVAEHEAHEKQQEKEQWLQLIPDDPGGLLREKFKRDHLRRQNGWYQ